MPQYHRYLVCKFLQRIKTTEEYYEDSLFDAISILPLCNAVSPCTIQEINSLCAEDKNTDDEEDDEENEAPAYKPFPKGNEAVQ
jgi:hypothetical protein